VLGELTVAKRPQVGLGVADVDRQEHGVRICFARWTPSFT
jgi:hypothetical protein